MPLCEEDCAFESALKELAHKPLGDWFVKKFLEYAKKHQIRFKGRLVMEMSREDLIATIAYIAKTKLNIPPKT